MKLVVSGKRFGLYSLAKKNKSHLSYMLQDLQTVLGGGMVEAHYNAPTFLVLDPMHSAPTLICFIYLVEYDMKYFEFVKLLLDLPAFIFREIMSKCLRKYFGLE